MLFNKRFWSALLVLVMVVAMVAVPAYAQTEAAEIGFVSKTAELIDAQAGRYDIRLKVPGADGTNAHDEIILMVDGSYSMDDEWPAMKAAITEIGKAVLNGNGNTQLTLMAFGMGDNEVLVHINSVDELTQELGELPGTLLYGRSSTNCESGFTGVAEYIENHDASLNDVHVVFISDGRINTDETPHVFYTWRENGWLRYSEETITMANLMNECDAISAGLNRSNAFNTVFGDMDAAEVAETATFEQGSAWIDLVWADVYAYSGLEPETAYPVSDVERAFVKFDKENNTYLQDCFYYALIGRKYPNQYTRTPAAANALAEMEQVKSMYVVDYDSYTAWMDTGITSEKSHFVKSDGIAGLTEALQGALTSLAKTPYNDVAIVDYMSKWVCLEPESLCIVDDTNGQVIYTAAEGWLIEEAARPTTEEVPVNVELVNPAEYALGGEATEGNVHGDVYRLVWNVKEGALLRSENYSLRYSVVVDTQEAGFCYDVAYDANGNTTVSYVDENGEPQTEEILVPEVEIPTENEVVYSNSGDTATGYWCSECGSKACDHYGKITKKGKWFMYNEVTLADGESQTFMLQAGNPKNHDNIVGSYTITRSGNAYYVTYDFTEGNRLPADQHLAVSAKMKFTGAPGKDDNQDYGQWFTVDGDPDTIYVFAHFSV